MLLGHRCVDNVEDVVEDVRHDALHVPLIQVSDHRVRLTAPCLAIGEDGTVVALETILDDGERRRSVYFLLLTSLVKDLIEAKSLILTRVARHYLSLGLLGARRWIVVLLVRC